MLHQKSDKALVRRYIINKRNLFVHFEKIMYEQVSYIERSFQYIVNRSFAGDSEGSLYPDVSLKMERLFIFMLQTPPSEYEHQQQKYQTDQCHYDREQ